MNIQAIRAQQTNVAFSAKLPTEDVIQTVTGYILRKGGVEGIYKVCDTMRGRPHHTLELIEASRQCTEVLTERFPALNTIIENSKKFFDGSKKTLKEITKWKNEQIKIFGAKECDVPEFKGNEFNVAEKTAEMLNGKKIITINVGKK